MFTLPASVHQHVWSKLIVSSVWFIVTGVAVMLSFMVMALNVGFLEALVHFIKRILEDITAYYAINGTVFLLELLVLVFVGRIGFCLQFYAALSIGHSFSNHKFAWSVAFFFILQFASQLVGSLLFALPERARYQLSAGRPGFPGIRHGRRPYGHGHPDRGQRGVCRRVLCHYHILLEKPSESGVN